MTPYRVTSNPNQNKKRCAFFHAWKIVFEFEETRGPNSLYVCYKACRDCGFVRAIEESTDLVSSIWEFYSFQKEKNELGEHCVFTLPNEEKLKERTIK